MNYMTVKETAEKWNISQRYVQRYCTEGRIDGAVKHGVAWAIPENAEKPSDMRKSTGTDKRGAVEEKKEEAGDLIIYSDDGEHVSIEGQRVDIPMPLLNTPFALGTALDSVDSIKDEDMRCMALAEYYYFSGRSDKASELVEKYLTSEDIGLKVSACWIYAYSNLALDRTAGAKQAIAQISALVSTMDRNTPRPVRGLADCVCTSASVLLHLPLPKILSDIKKHIPILPAGLKLFVLYVMAHHSYLNKKYGVCIGIAETALMLEEDKYPIPNIYLHLVAAMGYMNFKHTEEAKAHLMEAWRIAKPDGLIEPFAEHHGLLGGLLEATIKRDYPEDFKRIIAITYKFSSGWRKVHNSVTGHNVADNLTTTEFAVAMLASRDWTNKEIAAHMGISENTVKNYVTVTLQKLNISQRKELKAFMLS